MDYLLNETQKMVVDLTRKIAREKITPAVAAHYDETEEFPWDIMKILADAGLFGVYIPEQYGGLGGGIFELCLVTEELSRACGGISICYAATALGAYPILMSGSEEQKKKYMPDIAAGKKLAAFGLTEPNAGSDAGGIQTTARKEGDHYVINGTKQWITNGGEAEVYTIVAMTDRTKGARGATVFILDKGMPGFEFGKKEKKMGIRASATRELIFNDCKVSADRVLGKEGMGFIIAMRNFDGSRPGVGAQALGIAQGALDDAIAYARQRIQFGKPIISFQAIQHMLADMATQVEAARALIYATARMIDAGVKDIAKESCMSKLFPSDTAMKVTTDAVQIFGGYGYMREYPVEKRMRDAKITQIYEGTNQIQRNVIALQLIKQSAKGQKD
ncbi:acyl-CoA dehydrogenase [Candidatus Desantisbacteria bacterium CG_4_10_14_0_8_um_filter_48_22]|uniref:Acyl-CoA dehydrogenase n=1 Tax=Candidatus Desantisbacteria bacterium CG_4_10_14_0_8_um_filter_48_22 TaxID=1974543 RepID=A0A2M7SEU8_9BACT|nr:MAG: acyl-CoA dehydrogenase [Candidatus Desantisbacteria bacterium CG1_02_49_89]PIV55498.1 MAG: acyl-CoA dehydrogenase [Candidatus Desantisbacteria bacterium CG02_land_8_20_14_3_00_49_13]PIZ18055.1 MAG: acyl-CoA dehydrogenase [Candidatus Desantisbacteria bacterium CG_4_10_14_0_8_um_filter_48_22]